ncbi:hypothetical protein [Streptomyces chryseus]
MSEPTDKKGAAEGGIPGPRTAPRPEEGDEVIPTAQGRERTGPAGANTRADTPRPADAVVDPVTVRGAVLARLAEPGTLGRSPCATPTRDDGGPR